MGVGSRLADNIRRGKRRKSKEEMAELFNDVSYGLIHDFMTEAKSGAIKIDDTTDLMRLFQIWSEVNDIQNGGSGNGTLPPLSRLEKDSLNKFIPSRTELNHEGEPEDIIDLDELANLTVDEVDKMIQAREISLNKANEEAF